MGTKLLIGILTCIAATFSAIAALLAVYFAGKNIKALYDLKKAEIDLSLHKERAVYFEKIGNILTGISGGIMSYMTTKQNNFWAEDKRIKNLERKANYILDNESQKIFSEIISFIVDAIEKYRIFCHERSSEKEPYPVPKEQRDLLNKALQNLIKLENKYLRIDNIYPSSNA